MKDAGEATEREVRLLNFVRGVEFRTLDGPTERYLAFLAFLCSEQPSEFEQHTRAYRKLSRVSFAPTSDEIRKSGRSTQPHPIGNTGLWALTNMRAEQERKSPPTSR